MFLLGVYDNQGSSYWEEVVSTVLETTSHFEVRKLSSVDELREFAVSAKTHTILALRLEDSQSLQDVFALNDCFLNIEILLVSRAGLSNTHLLQPRIVLDSQVPKEFVAEAILKMMRREEVRRSKEFIIDNVNSEISAA